MNDRPKFSRHTRGVVLAVAMSLAFVSFGAAPASADNDLRNGFEDQFGRLLAVEAFRAGRQVLFAVQTRQRYDHGIDRVVQHPYGVERSYDHGSQRWDRHRVQRVEPVVQIHYHYGTRTPCKVVHETHVHHEHRVSRRGDERARPQRSWRRHDRRFH